jgi:guanylate kinase
MSRLMIIAGASGAGKSFLLEQLESRDADIKAVSKLSSRTAREYEKQGKQAVDLVFGVAPEIVRKCEYSYSYGQFWYGIQKSDIDAILSRSRTPIVIVRSSRIVRLLKKDYPSALAIFVQGVLSGEDLTKRLADMGRSDIKIGERRVRDESDFADYCNNIDAYDYVILNRFEPETFMAQYESVVSRELKKLGAANSVCLVSSNQSADRIAKIETLLKGNGHDQYELTRLGELNGKVVIAKSVEERLDHSELVVVDVDNCDGKYEYYVGYLRATEYHLGVPGL